MPWKPRFKRPPRDKEAFDENNPYVKMQVYLPKSLFGILKKAGEKMNLPLSRLMIYALDNELDSPVPFNYLCSWPLNEYIENAYADEATKIYNFLLKFPSGIGRDMLMTCRRDVGITNKNDLMLGLRELMKKDMVIEASPSKKTTFTYNPEYKYIRLREVNRGALLDRKKRELEKLEKELAKKRQSYEEATGGSVTQGIGETDRGDDESP